MFAFLQQYIQTDDHSRKNKNSCFVLLDSEKLKLNI